MVNKCCNTPCYIKRANGAWAAKKKQLAGSETTTVDKTEEAKLATHRIHVGAVQLDRLYDVLLSVVIDAHANCHAFLVVNCSPVLDGRIPAQGKLGRSAAAFYMLDLMHL